MHKLFCFTFFLFWEIINLLLVVISSLGPRLRSSPDRLTDIVDAIAISVNVVLGSISIGVHHLKGTYKGHMSRLVTAVCRSASLKPESDVNFETLNHKFISF